MERNCKWHQLAVAAACVTGALVVAACLWKLQAPSKSGLLEDPEDLGLGIGLDLLEGTVRDVEELAPLSRTSVVVSGRTLEDEGRAILEGYVSRRDCVLARSGYLDLLGNVWSCVVHGGDWVDVCLVERAGDDGCRVSVTRLDEGSLADAPVDLLREEVRSWG